MICCGDTITAEDRREIRNFQRFLALKARHYQRMLLRPRWQKYLNITLEEAKFIAKQEWIHQSAAHSGRKEGRE